MIGHIAAAACTTSSCSRARTSCSSAESRPGAVSSHTHSASAAPCPVPHSLSELLTACTKCSGAGSTSAATCYCISAVDDDSCVCGQQRKYAQPKNLCHFNS